ncbi:unnamed protein product, partial [Staurois parvus]
SSSHPRHYLIKFLHCICNHNADFPDRHSAIGLLIVVSPHCCWGDFLT